MRGDGETLTGDGLLIRKCYKYKQSGVHTTIRKADRALVLVMLLLCSDEKGR